MKKNLKKIVRTFFANLFKKRGQNLVKQYVVKELFDHATRNKVITKDGKNRLVGVRSKADNVFVFGKTRREHDERLIALCDKLNECGLICSPNNCNLSVEELEMAWQLLIAK